MSLRDLADVAGVPPFQEHSGDIHRGPARPSPCVTPATLSPWDPSGIGGLYSDDDRYAWRHDAGCYALLCESCRQTFAVTWDRAFAVCLGCYPVVDR